MSLPNSLPADDESPLRRREAFSAVDGGVSRYDRALVSLAQGLAQTRELDDGPAVYLAPLCQRIAETLGVDRVGVWRFGEEERSLTCIALVDRTDANGSGVGARIDAADLPAYFAALKDARHIDAEDAANDPRTRDLLPRYLEPLRIGAMLDCPIRIDGRIFGVLCAEHRPGPRAWTDDEHDFAAAAADFVAITLQSAALRRSESRYRRLFECLPLPGFQLDGEGRVLLANVAARRLAAEYADLSGKPFQTLIHPDDVAAVVDDLELVKSGEACASTAARLRVGSASFHWCAISIAHLPGSGHRDRKHAEIVLLAEDIEAQRARENWNREVQKLEAVARVSAGVAHDFLNILTIINSSARLAADALDNDSPLTDDLRCVMDATDRGANIARELMMIGREQQSPESSLDVAAAIEGMIPLLRRAVRAEVAADIMVGREPLCTTLTPTQLERIVLNLVSNANDAVPDGGRVTVSVVEREIARRDPTLPGVSPGRYVQICVRDNGTGMDERTRARLFEPYFTTKAPGRGTGLGLAVVWALVTTAGGHVHVDSGPRRGTTITLLFPSVPPAAT